MFVQYLCTIPKMKTERRYRWRVIDRGKLRVTRGHLTEEQVRRDYPECVPEPLLETEQAHEVPETAEEILAAVMRTPSPYGPGGR
jgi:hypothetical protein